MGYCTVQDILSAYREDILTQLTDADGVGFPDEATIQRAINKTSAFMDAYLGCRLQLPLSEPYPAPIVSMCIDATLRTLFVDLGIVREAQENRFREILRVLGDIASGNAVVTANSPGIYYARSASFLADIEKY